MDVSHEPRQPGFNAVLVGLILLLAVPVTYMGGYLLLMNHQTVSMTLLDGQQQVVWEQTRYAHYRVGGQVTARIFYPAQWLDRKLRPGYWNVDLPDGTSG